MNLRPTFIPLFLASLLYCAYAHAVLSFDIGICERIASSFRSPIDLSPSQQIKLENDLRYLPIKPKVQHNPLGASGSKIVTFENGMKGIFKYWNYKQDDYRAEVAVYEIAKKFGFSEFPPTVFRSIEIEPGRLELGSIQYFIPGSRTLKSLRKSMSFEEFSSLRLKDRIEYMGINDAIQFIDALVSNWDRNRGNLLFRFSGSSNQQFAVDGGVAFKDKIKFQTPIEKLRPKQEWIQILRETNEAGWRTFLGQFSLDWRQIDVFLDRRSKILEYWNDVRINLLSY